ncbi:MAG: peptide-methionine (S)-S-oxide reductase [Chloroflexi bacterium]|nr:peptide-methionine (S)-S-oxide reductase [Chloroflexota bacterium]|tara:strand:- start:429 stop:1064 length:636 start_codon:yes stop_codon:yes gene_type:complete
MGFFDRKTLSADRHLRGRSATMPVPQKHFVNGTPLKPPFPENMQTVVLGMGCFWGAERRFWEQQGVFSTAVGYAGGETPNPSYNEICSGYTGHSEVVLVVYDPDTVSFQQLLMLFWESHDPTQGMRQGNDIGTQYRSVIHTSNEEQQLLAVTSRDKYQEQLTLAGCSAITTEIERGQAFYYAEPYHQQYAAKVPGAYCGLRGTGVCYLDKN